jgi:hypothetical protein
LIEVGKLKDDAYGDWLEAFNQEGEH